MEKYVVEKSIDIKSTPAGIWSALTDPEKTKKYFYNCAVISDWKVGSDIVFKGKMFFIMPIEFRGKILEIFPGKLLKYSIENQKRKDKRSLVSIDLRYSNNITTVFVSDDVGQYEGAEKRFKRSSKGWDKILDGLKKFVEKE